MTESYGEETNIKRYSNDQRIESGSNTNDQNHSIERQLQDAEQALTGEADLYRDNFSQDTNPTLHSDLLETDNVELIEEGYDLLTYGGGSVETVSGFDPTEPLIESVGHESESPLPLNWTTMQDAAAIHYNNDFGAESVCGSDDRVQINGVTAPPFRMIAKLIITAADGNRYGGTGWFISPRTVMTAGHCIHSNRSGGWARSIEVIPGMNSRYRPFGSATATVFRSVAGWTRDNDPAQDYGCIILPESSPLGSQVGYFGFAALKDETLEKLLVNTSGYPGDKSFGTQWFDAGRITGVSPRRLNYMIDTFGGQSGSAVWRYSKTTGSRVAVGIHNYGGCDNKASRINDKLFSLMQKWKTSGM